MPGESVARRISLHCLFFEDDNDDDDDDDDDEDYALLGKHDRSVNSTVSSTTSVFAAFDIYEREGFDQIMRTVKVHPMATKKPLLEAYVTTWSVLKVLPAGEKKLDTWYAASKV